MSEERKQEIINDLLDIYESFEPYKEEVWDGFYEYIDEPTMFWLIATYTKSGKNKERIGGSWVVENCPEPLKSLP